MSQYAYDPYVPAQQTNTLGIAGFICSLVGIFTGGLLSPVGLIISLVAMGKQPRGFAIAGLILGILGTCGGLIVLVLFGTAILAAIGIAVLAIALSETEKVEITSDMIKIAAAVEGYKEQNDYLPAGLELLSLDESTRRDPWGQQYRYVQLDPKEQFDLVSAGEDKAFDTDDDVRLSEIDKVWAFSDNVKISHREGGGVVRINFGDNKIDVDGSSDGKVKISAGGKTIEVTGVETSGGGGKDNGDAASPAPDQPHPPSPPSAPNEPAAPPDDP